MPPRACLLVIAAVVAASTSHLASGTPSTVPAAYQDNSEPGNGKSPTWNATWTDQLKRDLLLHYDKFARPAQHTNITTITLDLMFRHVHLDDSKSLMTVNAWVQMSWKDEKLRWNSSDYGGLEKLHLADHEIWEPDIVLYNSAAGNNIDHYGNTHCLAFPDGTVLWVPPSQFSVFCEMDLTKWPFDRHTCNLRLGSWTYGGDMIDLRTNESKAVEMDLDVSDWRVISISKTRSVTYYACCQEPYMDIKFQLQLERVSTAYHALVINPAIALVILMLSIFWLPAHAGYKFIVTGITAVLTTIFLTYFALRVPSSGPNTPLIVLFYSNCLVLVSVSVIISIVTYQMSNATCTKPVPWFITNLIHGKLSTILWLSKHKGWSVGRGDRPGEELTERSTLDEDREDLGTPTRATKAPPEWLLLATAVDRLAFLVYVALFLGFAVRCLL